MHVTSAIFMEQNNGFNRAVDSQKNKSLPFIVITAKITNGGILVWGLKWQKNGPMLNHWKRFAMKNAQKKQKSVVDPASNSVGQETLQLKGKFRYGSESILNKKEKIQKYGRSSLPCSGERKPWGRWPEKKQENLETKKRGETKEVRIHVSNRLDRLQAGQLALGQLLELSLGDLTSFPNRTAPVALEEQAQGWLKRKKSKRRWTKKRTKVDKKGEKHDNCMGRSKMRIYKKTLQSHLRSKISWVGESYFDGETAGWSPGE